KAVDLFADPQLTHRNHFRPLDHVEMGTLSYNGPAYQLSETPAELRWAAPLLGEHTVQVLRDLLGYSEAEIEALAVQELLR
ncbi:MAG TPA: CoA transferase, partial [Caulobacteraceae bacterium]|nr:CoA transferase [Caulobacteraceae bacterium]